MRFKKNKRGQVGDTISWIVATIIIVIMLVLFVFGSSLLAGTKALSKYRSKIVSQESELDYDLILSKSLYTYYELEGAKEKTGLYNALKVLEAKGYFTDSLEIRSAEIKKGLYG